jgi:hypothetical protein
MHRLLGYQGKVLCSWNIPCDEESTVLYGIVREGIAHDNMVTYLNEDGVLHGIRGMEYATESDLIASDEESTPLSDLADKLLHHNGMCPVHLHLVRNHFTAGYGRNEQCV